MNYAKLELHDLNASPMADTSDLSLEVALNELTGALSALDDAVEKQLERRECTDRIDAEMQQILVDRSNLAQKLNIAEKRSERLESVNQEVSRRLVNAMETIRSVLDGTASDTTDADSET